MSLIRRTGMIIYDKVKRQQRKSHSKYNKHWNKSILDKAQEDEKLNLVPDMCEVILYNRLFGTGYRKILARKLLNKGT